MNQSHDHSVPESASGIPFQFERALFWLATCGTNGVVGVETDDDVSLRELGRIGVSEQDKLSFQELGHPFQARSHGLWNTLWIWLKSAQEADPFKQTAELHLVTNRPVPANVLVRRLAKSGKSKTEVSACVEELRRLGGDPPKKLVKTFRAVCAYTDEQLAGVISRVRLFDKSDATEGPELRARTIERLHLPPEEDPERIAQALLGWMQDVLRAAWRAKQPGWIYRADFDRQLDSLIRTERRERCRERAEILVPVDEGERSRAKSQTFVEQLLEVEASEPDVERAVDCYLRFGTERMRLCAQGDLVARDWTGFFHHLTERWSGIRRRCERNRREQDDLAVGREVYFGTADDGYRADLGGRATTHEYLTSGAYHRLADVNRVVWHPRRPNKPGEMP